MDAAFNRGIVKQRQPADVIQMRMSQKNAANVRRAKMYAELRLNRVEAVENILSSSLPVSTTAAKDGIT